MASPSGRSAAIVSPKALAGSLAMNTGRISPSISLGSALLNATSKKASAVSSIVFSLAVRVRASNQSVERGRGKEVKEMVKRIFVVLMIALVISAMVASSAAAAKPQFCYTSGNPFVDQPQCYETMRDCLNHQNR